MKFKFELHESLKLHMDLRIIIIKLCSSNFTKTLADKIICKQCFHLGRIEKAGTKQQIGNLPLGFYLQTKQMNR